jgi:hypothetical protein
MAHMKNLTVVELEIFSFLRNSTKTSPKHIQPALEQLLEKVKLLESNRFETRSFAYLDIISWLESKISKKSLAEIIHTKYLQSRHRGKNGKA